MSVERFKRGSFGTIFPTVAGSALGGYLGAALGDRFGKPDLGAVLGTISLGTSGRMLSEHIQAQEVAQAQQRAALANASSQSVKASSADGHSPWDIPLSEVPGAPVVQAYLAKGPGGGLSGAGRTFAGMALGGGAGALGGLAVGRGLEHAFAGGRHVKVPLTGMSLSDLFSAFGGTIGATHGMRHAKP